MGTSGSEGGQQKPTSRKAGRALLPDPYTEAERLHWTHRLGNLLLLNRNKNSQAQNFDFATKKEKYFSPAAGVTGFALTTLVLAEQAWTPEVVQQRQKNLEGLLADEWSL